MLQGLGVATVVGGVVGCAAGPAGGGDDDDTDGGTGSGSGDGGVTMCGGNLCIDLADAANAQLAAVDGSKVVQSPAGRLIVMQTDADTFVAMSAICTHAGCTVRYVSASTSLSCPCHGSRYDIAGAVIDGPATRDLRTFATSLAGNILTIML